MSIGPDKINIQLFDNQSRAINNFSDKHKIFIMSPVRGKGKSITAVTIT